MVSTETETLFLQANLNVNPENKYNILRLPTEELHHDNDSVLDGYKVSDCTTAKNEKFKIIGKKFISEEEYYKNLKMLSIKHENLFSCIECFYFKKEMWRVYELHEDISVYTLICNNFNWTENVIAYICKQVLKTLHFIHKLSFIHGDIRSDYVHVRPNGTIFLCLDNSIQPIETAGITPTPYWKAPEYFRNQAQKFTFAIDVWATGITIIEMAERNPPHINYSGARAIMAVVTAPAPRLQDTTKWSLTFQHFVSSLLEKDVKERPTSTVMLAHPFLKEAIGQKQLAEFYTTVKK